jgi:WD40 repeat protein
LRGHTAAVKGANFNIEATLIVSSSSDGTARLWEANTGTLRAVLKLTDDAVVQVYGVGAIFNPDSTLVLTYFGRVVRLWRASTGELIGSLSRSDAGFGSPLFSSDGSRILTVMDGTARLWDGRTGAPIATMSGHSGALSMYDFSRDGGRIVTVGQDFSPRLWDGKTGTAVATLSGHAATVFANFSPDGGTVWSDSWDRTTRLWNATTGAAIATIENATVPDYEACSLDGSRLATVVVSSDPRLPSSDAQTSVAQLVDVKTGSVLAALSGHTDKITHAEFSPDGKLIVTASNDKTARIWDAASAP